jgi:hypothetical protein
MAFPLFSRKRKKCAIPLYMRKIRAYVRSVPSMEREFTGTKESFYLNRSGPDGSEVFMQRVAIKAIPRIFVLDSTPAAFSANVPAIGVRD